MGMVRDTMPIGALPCSPAITSQKKASALQRDTDCGKLGLQAQYEDRPDDIRLYDQRMEEANDAE